MFKRAFWLLALGSLFIATPVFAYTTVFNPFTGKLDYVGGSSSISTSTNNTWTGINTFVPCIYVSTSTSSTAAGSICLRDVDTITIAASTSIQNGNLESWSDNSTPSFFVTSSFSTGGGGSGVITKSLLNCNGSATCARIDFDVSNPGDQWGVTMSQTFAYDSSKNYVFSYDAQQAHPGAGFGNQSFSFAYVANYCIDGNIVSSLPADFKCFQDGVGYADPSGDVGKCAFNDRNGTTNWHTVTNLASSTFQVTGPASSTLCFGTAFVSTNDTNATDTVYQDNFFIGTVTTTITTGTKQLVYTAPGSNYPHTFEGSPVWATQGVSTTEFSATTGTFSRTLTTNNLTFQNGAFYGGVPIATDASGTLDYIDRSDLGPWRITPDFNGYVLINNKNACGGSASSTCGLYTQALAWGDIVATHRLAIGPYDPYSQNQPLLVSAGNSNGSIWATSGATPSSRLADEIGSSGSGCRLTYVAGLGAFRIGCVDDTQWDYDNQGFISFASGLNTQATATGSAAFNVGSTATASNTFASNGGHATAIGATGIGDNAIASGQRGISIGRETTAQQADDVAIGQFSNANGSGCLALFGFCTGNSSGGILGGTASGTSAVAIGNNSVAGGANSLALLGSNVSGAISGGIGSVQVSADGSFAIGSGIHVTGQHSEAYGTNVDVSGQFSRIISLAANGISNPELTQSYVTAWVGDSVNGGRIVIGSTTAQDALVTIDDVTKPHASALTVLNGKVGIGTTTPATSLGIDGAANDARIDLNNHDTGGRTYSIGVGGDALDNGQLNFRNRTNGTNVMTFDGVTNYVGINTTTPSSRFAVVGTSTLYGDVTFPQCLSHSPAPACFQTDGTIGFSGGFSAVTGYTTCSPC